MIKGLKHIPALRVRGPVYPGNFSSPSQGKHRDKQQSALKLSVNLVSTINLAWTVEENPEKTNADTGRTCKPHKENDSAVRII